VGIAGTASAQTYLVDTGPGAASGGLSLTVNQYLAGQFTLDLGSEIEALEGWMIYPTIIGELPVDVVIYGDDGGLPDVTNEIYFLRGQVDAALSPNWHGITIPPTLPLYLYGGRPYWLAFEVPSGSFGSGAMPPTPLAELDGYAVDGGLGYVENPTANLGIRVLPEPTFVWLLVSGGLGLLCADRLRRSAQEGDA
jgi:hypothetical protein